MISIEKEQLVLTEFKRKKIMTIQQITDTLECSIHTSRKRLFQWNTFTSYNKNGRYYVLPQIPQFDGNGLWNYKGVFFSRFGTLKNTVIHLVKHSQYGLSSTEIGRLVGLKPRSFMLLFKDIPQLRREKINGRFIYFSVETTTFNQQKQHRENQQEPLLEDLPTDSIAIMILSDIIKHPETTVQACVKRLKRKNILIKEESVNTLLFFHNITLKKTPDLTL